MKQKDINWNIVYGMIMLSITMIASFVTLFAYRGELDNLQEEIDKLKGDGKIFNFKVECDGNGVLAEANYSINDYDLYKEMIEIFDIKNCEIYDVNVLKSVEEDGK